VAASCQDLEAQGATRPLRTVTRGEIKADIIVKDGVIDEPTRCHFDPQVMQCAGADAATCLTTPQVKAARRIYAPAKNPKTGAEIFAGLEPGSEMGWAALAGPMPFRTATDHYRFGVFKNPNWDFKTFDFDKDLALADTRDHGTINATDPNLQRFFSTPGELRIRNMCGSQPVRFRDVHKSTERRHV
jgi:Tannase and feruloyl esterase